MLVVLISPYSSIEATGLRTLSACLQQEGFQTRMVFIPDLPEVMASVHYGRRHVSPKTLAQIVELCKDAGLVGISVMTPSFHLARELTDAIHANRQVPVLWGGIHPTACPLECLEHADLVCVGEGEHLIVDLTKCLQSGSDYHLLANLAYLDKSGNMVMNPLGPLDNNIDQLPFPDYDYQQHYVLHEGNVVPFTRALLYFYLTDLGSWASGPVYGVFSSRGCPYRCTYCCNNTLSAIYPSWGKMRNRSPANVIAEIQAMRQCLPRLSAIILRDDTFLAHSVDYIAEFSHLYRREVGLPFRVYTTAQTADAKKLNLLAGIGSRFYIIMGIQTGSKEIQKQYKRSVNNKQMLRAVQVIHQFNYISPRPMYDVITDNPYEADPDRWETLQLIHQLPKPYRLSLFSLTFYPGTELYDSVNADGIERDIPNQYVHNCQIVRPGYYNLALLCHGLNLPKPILNFLSRRIVFNVFMRQPFDGLCGLLMKGLLKLRFLLNQRTYARRWDYWLAKLHETESD